MFVLPESVLCLRPGEVSDWRYFVVLDARPGFHRSAAAWKQQVAAQFVGSSFLDAHQESAECGVCVRFELDDVGAVLVLAIWKQFLFELM